ncbi:MAG TPA: TIGR02679 family protein [Acidimicrobiales bacterium]|nr:TIGR02679 family protein [Acidimicrobiales bacterium]
MTKVRRCEERSISSPSSGRAAVVPDWPVLAAEITGNAHGLDRGKPAGTLAVHALSWLAEQPFPRDAADWRRAWAEAGVACDDLSCDVLVLNLPGWASEPLRLTLRQVALWQPKAQNAQARMVYVTENPAIIAAAADHFGDRSPTMVCLDGIPSTAALVLLHGLVTAGSAVRYHGDFDWRGLAIAGVLARKVPSAQPWRFTTTDYVQAVRHGLGTVPLSGAPHMSPWDPELATIMKTAGTAIYEEQVIEDLLEDLDNSRREPDQPKRSPGRGHST